MSAPTPHNAALRPNHGETWEWRCPDTGRMLRGRIRSIGLYGHATGAAEGVSVSIRGERRRRMVWLAHLVRHGWRVSTDQ
jgi:hypothetical protein